MKEFRITQAITPRDSHALTRYFNDISSSRPLSPDEEVALAFRIQKGDMEARNVLVKANLRFVISIAKQYQGTGIVLDDLINEGNIGLIRAAERFDPTRGFKFDTFAVWWIRQAITASIGENYRTVRLPLNVSSMLLRLKRVSAKFEAENERQPTADELAELVDMPVERINAIWVHTPSVGSLDAPILDDSETTVVDMVEDKMFEPTDNKLMYESLQHDVDSALSVLNPRDASILRMYFGIGGHAYTLEEIADDLQLTRERVRQLREHALIVLKHSSGSLLSKYAF